MKMCMVVLMLVLAPVVAAALDEFTTPDIEFWWGGFSYFDGTYTVTLRAADNSDSTVVATGVPHLGTLAEHTADITLYTDVETVVSVYGIENGQTQAVCRTIAVYTEPDPIPNGCGCRMR